MAFLALASRTEAQRAAAAAEATPALDTAFVHIDSLANADLARLRVPGMSIAFVAGGRVALARGYGVADNETKAPVTPGMLFRVGSVSKPVSALAIIAEARARGIPLNAPIGRYMRGLAPRIAVLTLDQLLSHTAGVEQVVTAMPIEDHPNPAELVRQARAWNDSILFTEPGDVESYSNFGFVIAGAFIETVARKPFGDVVAARVFRPLGITDATYSADVAMMHPFSQGHLFTQSGPAPVVRPIRTDARHLPPTFLWISAPDLARLEIALMNHGRIDGKQALDSASVDLAMAPHARIPRDLAEWYGYGFIVTDFGGVRRVRHGGRVEGYVAFIDMVPAVRRGFVVLANRGGGTPGPTLAALTTLLGASIRDRGGDTVSSMQVPTRDLIGRFVNGPHSFDVTEQNGTVHVHGSAIAATDAVIDGTVTSVNENRVVVTYTNDAGRTSTLTLGIVRDRDERVKYFHDGEIAFRRRP